MFTEAKGLSYKRHIEKGMYVDSHFKQAKGGEREGVW